MGIESRLQYELEHSVIGGEILVMEACEKVSRRARETVGRMCDDVEADGSVR